MDRTNNACESIYRSRKKFSTSRAKNINTVLKNIYNCETDDNKIMLCTRQKLNAYTIIKFDKIRKCTTYVLILFEINF